MAVKSEFKVGDRVRVTDRSHPSERRPCVVKQVKDDVLSLESEDHRFSFDVDEGKVAAIPTGRV